MELFRISTWRQFGLCGTQKSNVRRGFFESRQQVGRIIWIDAIRGYAITLVVFGHVLEGAMNRGWLSRADGDAAKLIHDFIYSFHMPLFFIISGALGIKSMRAAPGRAIISRTGSVAWPYVFWGVISILMWPFISQFTLNPMYDVNFFEGLKGGLRALLFGQSSWFLWTLFLTQCILICALQVAPIKMVFASSVIAFLLLANKDLGTLNAVIRFFPFLAFGCFIGPRIDLIKCGSKIALIAVGIFLFGALFALVLLRVNETPILWVCCGIIGSVASLMLVQCIGTTRVNLFMAICGAASLVVFLLHPYFHGTARALIFWGMGPSIWWQLAIPTVAGVVGPTLVFLGAERLGLQWIFRLDLNRLIWPHNEEQNVGRKLGSAQVGEGHHRG